MSLRATTRPVTGAKEILRTRGATVSSMTREVSPGTAETVLKHTSGRIRLKETYDRGGNAVACHVFYPNGRFAMFRPEGTLSAYAQAEQAAIDWMKEH